MKRAIVPAISSLVFAAACGSSGDGNDNVRPLVPIADDPPANSSAPTGDPQRPAYNPNAPAVNSAQPLPNPQQPTLPGGGRQTAPDINAACSSLCSAIDQRCYGDCNTTCGALSRAATPSCLGDAVALVRCLLENDALDCRDNGNLGIDLRDCRESVSQACQSVIFPDND